MPDVLLKYVFDNIDVFDIRNLYDASFFVNILKNVKSFDAKDIERIKDLVDHFKNKHPRAAFTIARSILDNENASDKDAEDVFFKFKNLGNNEYDLIALFCAHANVINAILKNTNSSTDKMAVVNVHSNDETERLVTEKYINSSSVFKRKLKKLIALKHERMKSNCRILPNEISKIWNKL